ncbi:MAG: HNH endonuclease [Prevotella sp.]|nr:HNH endonuclease [Prevotella sp.]
MWKKYYYKDKETDYSVSTEGEVRRDSTNHILSQSYQQDYKFVTLTIDKKQKRMRVHRLVAETFMQNPENKPYVNHIDGNRSNNNIDNLEWVTPAENVQHAVNIGLIKGSRAKAVIQYNLNGDRMMIFSSATEAAEETGSSQSKITMCCQKKRETANGYQWRYADGVQDVVKVEDKHITGKKVAQCDEDWNILNIYPSFREAARAVNGTSSAISRVCSGTNIRHKGFKWKLVEDIVQEDI